MGGVARFDPVVTCLFACIQVATIEERTGMSRNSWELLCGVKSGAAIDMLGQDVALLDDDIYKISESQYCLAEIPLNSPDNILRIISMYWACSEKSFRRALFKEIEGDDLVICDPPSELLPPKSASTYRQILDGLRAVGAKGVMEYALYRVMSDGAFVHRCIESDSAAYYFRSPDFVDDESPYAILWKLARP